MGLGGHSAQGSGRERVRPYRAALRARDRQALVERLAGWLGDLSAGQLGLLSAALDHIRGKTEHETDTFGGKSLE